MNDTSPIIATMVVSRFSAMTPSDRVAIAVQMNATARSIVLASLPAGLSPREQRRMLCRRLYGDLEAAAFGCR